MTRGRPKRRPREGLALPLDKKCPICGKVFVPAPEHIFKRGSKWFDKWSCYNKYVTEADKNKGRRKKVRNED